MPSGGFEDADLASAAFRAQPYPLLNEMRERSPVVWNESLRSWCVTRYDHVGATFKDSRFLSSRINQFVAGRRHVNDADRELMAESIGLWLVFNDPPRHTYLRKLTQEAFSLRAIQQLRPRIETLVDELLDPYSSTGSIEFVRAFAYPLPATVIADLLGVPREHIEDLKQWSDDLGEFVLSNRIEPTKFEAAARALENMNRLFGIILAEKRRQPGADLMDDLIAARDGQSALSETELLAFCILLLFAGHETTTHYLSNSVRALLHRPDQADLLGKLSGDPRALNGALDELLRFDGPVVAVSRVTGEALQLGEARLESGDRVFLFTAAANRDPRVFDRPDELNLTNPKSGRTLGFGFGIHLCLGIHLARLEAAVALPRIFARLDHLRLDAEPDDWTDTLVIRGPRRLQLSFDDRGDAGPSLTA